MLLMIKLNENECGLCLKVETTDKMTYGQLGKREKLDETLSKFSLRICTKTGFIRNMRIKM